MMNDVGGRKKRREGLTAGKIKKSSEVQEVGENFGVVLQDT